MFSRSTRRSSVRRIVRVVGTVALTCALLAVSAALPDPATAAVPTFTFQGSGWGHGIGLSQWGAKGFAEAGHDGEWIARYYHPGTSIGTAASKTMQVNLDAAANYRSGTSGYNAGFTRASWRVRPGWTGGSLRVNGTDWPDGTYTLVANGNSVLLRNPSGTNVAVFTGAVNVSTVGGGTPSLTQVVDASGPFGHTYVRYRGSMRVTASNDRLKLLNHVGMEDYLRGVVPRESPASWHIEALKAQAIVARSYAHRSGNELYCTTWSQVYNGHSRGSNRASTTAHEEVRTNQAIDATANRVVTYKGAIVQTFFHSSSGGHTANIEDVWLGTGEPSSTHPYRRGVPDPHVAAAGCPNTPWSGADVKTLDGRALANALRSHSAAKAPSGAGTSVWVSSLYYHFGTAGHVRTVDITWSNGAKTTGFPGATLRTALGLRSTRLALDFPHERIAHSERYSTSVAISQRLYPAAGSAGAAVIAAGEDHRFPDALTAAGLAGAANGPVLLTQQNSISWAVLNELRRLQVGTVYLVGGTQAISESVEEAIRSRGHKVERLTGGARYGNDRYGTAASVAMKIKELGGFDGSVLVASGEGWPDAAIAASISAGTSRPIVLVSAASTPEGTQRVLADLGATQTIVFGGPSVISANAIAELNPAPARRFGMTGDRYRLAADVARWAIANEGYTMDRPYIATGEAFPDSVTGGVLAGATRNPLLFVTRETAPSGTTVLLAQQRQTVELLQILGGPAAVGPGAIHAMAGALQ